MNTEIPERQLVEWSIKRMQTHRRALRGLDELLRMSRHSGRAFIYPVRPDRTVLVWRPFNRFLQTTIVHCGRTRITNRRTELGPCVELPITDGDRLLIVGRPEFLGQWAPVLQEQSPQPRQREYICVTDATVHYEIDPVE